MSIECGVDFVHTKPSSSELSVLSMAERNTPMYESFKDYQNGMRKYALVLIRAQFHCINQKTDYSSEEIIPMSL